MSVKAGFYIAHRGCPSLLTFSIRRKTIKCMWRTHEDSGSEISRRRRRTRSLVGGERRPPDSIVVGLDTADSAWVSDSSGLAE